MAAATDRIQQLLEQALASHQVGRLDAAERHYQEVLALAPDNPDALGLLGALAQDIGDSERAETLLRRVLELGCEDADVHYNLAVALRAQERHLEAVESFERSLALAPDSPDCLQNLGESQRALGALDVSLRCFERALELSPGYAHAHNSLGITLQELGRLDAAAAAFRQAIQHDPRHAAAFGNLGGVLNWMGEHGQALEALRRAAALREDHGRVDPQRRRVPVHRIRHDAAQMRYLRRAGVFPEPYAEYADYLDALDHELEGQGDGSYIEYGPETHTALAPSFNRIVYSPACDAVAGGAVNPALDAQAIGARYAAAQPCHVVVDEFLSEAALERLRRFCLEATIWKKNYRNGYLSARLGHGFATPLLLQIASELRTRFPHILGTHQLTQVWAFKCDSRLRGVEIHADYAAVNVNFWITPSEACLAPESGGLLVWDRGAPPDWSFEDYNKNEAKIRAYLKAQGARAINVPHRGNRALIFDPTRFHETDRIDFRDRYEDRRINVTLSYGVGLRTN